VARHTEKVELHVELHAQPKNFLEKILKQVIDKLDSNMYKVRSKKTGGNIIDMKLAIVSIQLEVHLPWKYISNWEITVANYQL